MAVAPPPASRLTNIKEPFRPLQSLNVKGVSELHESSMNDALICWLSPLKCSAHTHTHTCIQEHTHTLTHLLKSTRSSSADGLATSQPVACQSYSPLLERTHTHKHTHANKAVYAFALVLCARNVRSKVCYKRIKWLAKKA